MSELPAPHTWKAPAHDPLCRQQHWEGGDCFDCRLIDKVRADERARILDSLHTQRELADDDQRWADLRAKVEALPWRDACWGLRRQVLALIDRGQ